MCVFECGASGVCVRGWTLRAHERREGRRIPAVKTKEIIWFSLLGKDREKTCLGMLVSVCLLASLFCAPFRPAHACCSVLCAV